MGMTASDDSLDRFVEAQNDGDSGGTYVEALAELKMGEKRSH